MIASRSLEELHPIVRAKVRQWLAACAREDIELLVTSTYRDFASQDALYAQGRTKPGSIVTNAKGGDSFHNWRVATDVVPLVAGKPLWQVFLSTGKMHPIWKRTGELAESCGLEWAGRWKKFKEYAHVQYTGGLTINDFKQGKILR